MGSLILLESRERSYKEPGNAGRAIFGAWIIAFLLIGAAFLMLGPPIAQDQAYHVFADRRTLWGVPNFWNVVSNLIFAVIAIPGLRTLRDAVSRVLFTGVLLTCFGSGYYHLAPSDA